MNKDKCVQVSAAVIVDKQKILICQRPVGKNLALLWEFPGGKVEAGETYQAALQRECMEELDIDIRVEEKLSESYHEYPNINVCVHFFKAEIVAGAIKCKEHNALQWVTPGELQDYEFCPADNEFIALLSAWRL